MRTLLWKELRENLRWAALAMLAFGVALFYALQKTRYGSVDYGYYDGITLCKDAFLIVTTFGCPAIGLFLGLMQVLPELKRDRWAALLHRPVSRQVIFWGKAASGVILYLVAVLVPFGTTVWIVATPGNFPTPFVPEMMKPGIADLSMGLAYYFAALTLALQRGGWIGLKIFPLLAAVHVSFFVVSTNLFYVAIEAALLMALALMFAAWGAMLSQDRFGGRPWLGRLAFLIAVYYGAFGMGDLAKSLLNAVGPRPRTEFVRYEVTKDGVPLRLHYVNNVVVEVKDVDGKPVTDPKYKPNRVRNEIDYLNQASNYIGDAHGWKPGKRTPFYRESRTYVWAERPYSHPRMEQWFYLVKSRDVVCFLPQKKIAVERLDRSGFQPLTAKPTGFPEDVQFRTFDQDTAMLESPEELRYVFLAKREIIDLPLPVPGPIFGTAQASADSPDGRFLFNSVALKDGLAVYDDKGALFSLIPYRKDVERWGQVSFGVQADREGFFLWYEPSAWIDCKTKKTMPSFVDVVNLQGDVLASYTLPPLPEDIRPISLTAFLNRRLHSPAMYFGTMLYKKIGATLGSERMKNDLKNQFGSGWRVTREISIWSSIVSLVFAGITLFWTRRVFFSWHRALAWTVFVFAFNLAGFIAFRLVADWPRLVACKSCGRLRPVDRAACPHCGSGWETPSRTGTEIFDQKRT